MSTSNMYVNIHFFQKNTGELCLANIKEQLHILLIICTMLYFMDVGNQNKFSLLKRLVYFLSFRNYCFENSVFLSSKSFRRGRKMRRRNLNTNWMSKCCIPNVNKVETHRKLIQNNENSGELLWRNHPLMWQRMMQNYLIHEDKSGQQKSGSTLGY